MQNGPLMFRFQHGGFSLGRAIFLFMVLVVFVVALMWLFSTFMRQRDHRTLHPGPNQLGGATPQGRDALKILDERFARGEIDVDDYKARRELLLDHASQ